ncbi:MAG: T9SS type A sorting domain-containing protein [Sphingobacteriaceae bacterium]|nr:T9SS type A sorting domain-containing protein [Sphingobacteriaceae bacterium]
MKRIGAIICALLSFKLSAQINYQWAGKIGSTMSESATAVASDPSGNVYVAGHFNGTADFDPGPGTTTLSSLGGQDAFIAKYNSSGAFIWVKHIGGTNTDWIYDMSADANGVYVAGNFIGTCNFNIGGSPANLTSLGGGTDGDGFFASYSTAGTLNWVNRLGSTANDRAISLAIDASTNVYVTGFIGANTDFDPGPGVLTLSVSGTYNAYFAKYTSAGALVFARQIIGSYSEGDQISIDASNNIYITGSFSQLNDFDPGIGTFNLTTSGALQLDIYLAKYNSSGNFVYAKQIGGTGVDIGFGLQPDASGNVYLGGVFSNVCDFDPGIGVTTITSNGQGDLFVAKYDASGNYIWAYGTGGTTNDYCYGLAIDGSNNVYITGRFLGTGIDFDPGPGTATLTGSANTFYVAGYNSAGAIIFANSFGNIASEGRCAYISGSTIYLSGMFASIADFDFGVGTATLTATGSNDAFFAKYNLCNGSAPAQPSAISGNTSVCVGSSQNYSVTNDPQAVSYSWFLPGGWIGSSSTNTIGTTAGLSGVISVVANGTCGSSPARTINITVNPLPIISASITSPVCQGANLILSSSGGSTYTWTGPNNFSVSVANFTITNAMPIHSGTYISTVTNSLGCTNSVAVTATVNPTPAINVGNNSPVCVGNNLLLTSTGGTSFVWSGPNSYTSAIQNPTISNAQIINSGNYTLTISGAFGCTNSAVTNATISPPPSPTIVINSPICSGQTLSLSVSGGATYTWTGPNSFNSTAQNTVISNAGSNASGNYTVVAAVGSCTSLVNQSATVNITPTVLASSNANTICAGQSVTLTASGANSYSWNSGGSSVNEIVTPTISTSYTVLGTAINGCTNIAIVNQSVVICSGLIGINYSEEVKIFPNPFKNVLHLNFNNPANTCEIKIINLLGQVVFSAEINSESASLNLDQLPHGMFYLQIVSGEKLIANRIIIHQL